MNEVYPKNSKQKGHKSIQIKLRSKMENSLSLLPPALYAVSEGQKKSLGELPKQKKFALYETVTEENLTPYHQISFRPITKKLKMIWN